jgi:hypothetical protein
MATGNDMKAHKGTYGGFITLLKWSVPFVAIITFIIILAIAE